MQTRKGIKEKAFRLSLDAMGRSDPSEGIRASEIVPLVASRFEVKHFRYFGGTLLLLIFNEIAGNFSKNDAEMMPLIKALIALDDFLIDNKVLPSYHVYMVCQKTNNPLPMQTTNVLPQEAAVFPTGDLETRTLRTISTGLIDANPNPFPADARGLGSITVSWASNGTSEVEIHIDAPNGPHFHRSGPGSFIMRPAHWVRNGLTFYLQNVSGGLALAPDNTLAVITVRSA